MRNTKIFAIAFILIVGFSGKIFSQAVDTSSNENRIESSNSDAAEIKIPLAINSSLLVQNHFVDKEKSGSDIQLNSSLPGVTAEADKSSFTTDLFYVLGTAAVAAVVYFLWPEKDTEPSKTVTFGKPVHP